MNLDKDSQRHLDMAKLTLAQAEKETIDKNKERNERDTRTDEVAKLQQPNVMKCYESTTSKRGSQ